MSPFLRRTACAAATALATTLSASACAAAPPAVAVPGVSPATTAPATPVQGGAPLLRVDAQAVREVTDDTVVVAFVVERDGAQAAPLQSSVNAVLQSALADLRRDPSLQVRSGPYFTHPRTSRDGRIEGWRVHAELIAESTDMEAVSRATKTLAGRMNVGSLGFRLSNARRAEVEHTLTAEAAERFYARARAAARALGYGDVELVEANVGSGGPPVTFTTRSAMQRGDAAAESVPVPVEPGRSQVSVTIGGVLRLKNP